MFYAYYLGVIVASLFVTLNFKTNRFDDDTDWDNPWVVLGIGIGFGISVSLSWLTVGIGFYKKI